MPQRPVPVLLVAVLLAAGCSAGSKGTNTTAAPTATPSAGAPTATATTRRISHVFVINLENKRYSQTWGPSSPATYLNGTLRPQGQLLSQYYGIGHASLDNYIAQISGQSPNPATQSDCPTYTDFAQTGTGAYDQALGQGCVYPASVQTIADQLSRAGKTWKTYQEDIANGPSDPKTCRHPALGSADSTLVARSGDQYATRHDPFVYFHSIIDAPICQTAVVGLDQLRVDLASAATTPNLAYITPNLCHDGHDAPCVGGEPGGLQSADAFLAEWAPKILAAPAFRDGMLIVAFDESEVGGGADDSAACCQTPPSPNAGQPGLNGPGGGLVGALVLSARTTPGTTNDKPYNHYALLCSMEDLFGLPHLGFAGAPGLSCFGSDVFNAA